MRASPHGAITLRERHAALLELREFSRHLLPQEVRLLHRIAAGFHGAAADFRAAVLDEFERKRGGLAVPAGDDIMTATTRALGRRSSAVSDTVHRIKRAWPELSSATRAAVLNEIDAAIARNRAGGMGEVACWQEVLALSFQEGRADGLSELRRRAAGAAFARRFGDADPQWSTVGEEWRGPAPDGERTFAVRFEPGTAIVREAISRST